MQERTYATTDTVERPIEAVGNGGKYSFVSTKAYPLTIQFNNEDGSQKWALFFQSKPECRMRRKGAMPTLEEMLTAVQFLPIPAFMVEVFVICAASADVEG